MGITIRIDEKGKIKNYSYPAKKEKAREMLIGFKDGEKDSYFKIIGLYDGEKLVRTIDDEERRLKDVRTVAEINRKKYKEDPNYPKTIEVLKPFKFMNEYTNEELTSEIGAVYELEHKKALEEIGKGNAKIKEEITLKYDNVDLLKEEWKKHKVGIEIRFIKSCDGGKIGDIKNYSKASAKSLVEQGYAEYIDKTDSPQETGVKKGVSEIDIRRLDVLDETQSQRKTPNTSNEKSLDETKSNTSNTSNTSHTYNTSNTTTILDLPDRNADKIYYFLYDNKEATAQQLTEISTFSSVSGFYNLKSNDENIIISRREGKAVYYGITQELRETIELRISQKAEALKRDDEEKQKETSAQDKREEFYTKIKGKLRDKTIFSFEGEFVYLDLKELQECETSLFNNIFEEPRTNVDIIQGVITEEGFGENNLRFKNISILPKITIDNLRSKDLDKLICIESRVTSITDVRPHVVSIKFECPSCGTIISVLQTEKKIKEPSRCSCGRRGGFKEISQDLEDGCIVRLEDLKDLSDAPCLKSVKAFVTNQFTKEEELKKFNPGNDLIILGILKPIKQYSSTGAASTTLDHAIEILEIEEFEPEINVDDFEDKDIKKFEELSKQIDKEGLDNLVKSFAPDVHGYKTEKEVLIIKSCQARNLKGKKNRTKSNILFVGDPGAAKTVMTKTYGRVNQGTNYISGSGSSAVGLTSSTERTEDGWMLKPGVLPMTKEDAIIDEFNLVGEEEMPKLQEAMSEAQITVNKASIHAKLSVSCGITASANPKRGIFDLQESLVQQFNLTPQILNRFDAIFAIKDNINLQRDMDIAKIMIDRDNDKIKAEYDETFLRKFFTYSRSRPEPKLHKEAEEYLPIVYGEVRNTRRSNNSSLVNPRFIESLIRLSKGYAKLRGSSDVMKKDIDIAYEILSNSYLDIPKESSKKWETLTEDMKLKQKTMEKEKQNKKRKYKPEVFAQ